MHQVQKADIAASNMTPMEQRKAERFGVALPITMEDVEGATHDLSATGILFETTLEPSVGATVNVTLEYLVDGHTHQMACEAQVVRVERVGDKVNVAARLATPLFTEPQ
jgi:hypothetical protein